MFTTSLKGLDQDWIFNLRFLLISLVDKRIDVVPSIENKEVEEAQETFDEALREDDWLAFFFDLLRKSELLTSAPNATRRGWLKDVGESLGLLKKVYDGTKEYDAVVLDASPGLVSTMCAKKKFNLPTRDELVNIMKKKEINGMVRRTWLLSDEEWEAAENKGRDEGRNEGERNILTQMIGLRFPTITSEFITNALKTLNDSYVKELMSALINTSSPDEFQKRMQALAPGC